MSNATSFDGVAAEKKESLSSPLVEGPFEAITPDQTTAGDQVCAVTPVLVIARDEPRGDKGDAIEDAAAEEADEDTVEARRRERIEEQSQKARDSAAHARAVSLGLVADDDGDEPEDDGRTLAELRDEAHERGLPTSGTKAELRERLANG